MNVADAAAVPVPSSLVIRWRNRVGRLLRFCWRWFLGAFLCATPPGSVVALGWALRRSHAATHGIWGTGVTPTAPTRWVFADHVRPALGRARNTPGGIRRRARAAGAALFGSLGRNFALGFSSILVVWTVTLPGCVLWLFAWYDGWNNSFTKGYENAEVGPLTALGGTALFIMAMMYVPMAQARHAATGDWRAFYRFRVVWRLMRASRLRYLLLAAFYAASALPVMVMKTAPFIFTQIDNAREDLGAAEARELLDGYFFKTCLAVFPIFVALRVVGGRVYAKAADRAVRSGALAPEELHPTERDALGSLAPDERTRARRGDMFVTVVWVGALVAVWFVFVAQIFISEFLNYHPGVGWLNQPTAQLPWFRYIPSHLQQ
jgi:hypothetical protein